MNSGDQLVQPILFKAESARAGCSGSIPIHREKGAVIYSFVVPQDTHVLVTSECNIPIRTKAL